MARVTTMRAARAAAEAAVPSPCVSVCRMDAASGLCVGCLRTLDEIAQWSTMADDDKRAVLASIETRDLPAEPTKLIAPIAPITRE